MHTSFLTTFLGQWCKDKPMSDIQSIRHYMLTAHGSVIALLLFGFRFCRKLPQIIPAVDSAPQIAAEDLLPLDGVRPLIERRETASFISSHLT